MSNKYKNVLEKGKVDEGYLRCGVVRCYTYTGYLDFLTKFVKKPAHKVLRYEKEIINLVPFIKRVFKDLGIEEVDYGWKNNIFCIFYLFEKGRGTDLPLLDIARFMKYHKLETWDEYYQFIREHVDDESTKSIIKLIEKRLTYIKHTDKFRYGIPNKKKEIKRNGKKNV